MRGETRGNEAAELGFPLKEVSGGILSLTFLLEYWRLDLGWQQLLGIPALRRWEPLGLAAAHDQSQRVCETLRSFIRELHTNKRNNGNWCESP